MKWRWLGLASLTLTCAPAGTAPVARAQVRPSSQQSLPASLPPSTASASVAAVQAPAPVAALTPAPALCPSGPLQIFFDALTQLGRGKRQSNVRVLWLGDSHTNADFLSGAVRSRFTERFGDSGPGFVRIGTSFSRREGVKLVRVGSWNVDPDPPSRRTPQSDGVFGLGGTRAEPMVGATYSLQVTAKGEAAQQSASFDVSYALPPHAAFKVVLGAVQQLVEDRAAPEVGAPSISHLTLSAPLGTEISISGVRGAPQLFGVSIERNAAPGVVLETSGIDGARLETALAWNEPTFVDEVARRSPELLVVAYGTNEAFDGLRVEKYAAQLAALVGRVRRGAPQASCLVLGPTDAPLAEGSVPRVAEVTAVLQHASAPLGCSFVSLQQLMGGVGSFARGMRAKERLAQPDKLHLTPRGYRELGGALASLLLDAYSLGRVDL
ncbi:MAG TPA: GDSL-type esterase/lipase family protein [Polyangiaceae bacterium]|nr:GDSL-type esterase/lipase family protein [Polyangiaceae bacterium]